jgi:hypothetical protein
MLMAICPPVKAPWHSGGPRRLPRARPDMRGHRKRRLRPSCPLGRSRGRRAPQRGYRRRPCAPKPKCCPNVPARKIARFVHGAARDKVRAIAMTEPLATGGSPRIASLRFTLAIRPLRWFGRLDDVVVVGMGGEWRGVPVVGRIEPKPVAPPPKNDAPVVIVVASHGVAAPELPSSS